MSDVKPLVTVAAYTDVETGQELYQEVCVCVLVCVYLFERVRVCI